jgi:hypothetical protein
MIQYTQGRIGEDRDTVLDMGRIPDYDTREWMPSGLPKGNERAPGDASVHAAEPAPKRARATEAQAPCSHSTVATEGRFIPLTDAPADARDRNWQMDPVRRSTTGVSRTHQMTKGEACSV